MSNTLTLTVDNQALVAALRRSPERLKKNMADAVSRITASVARDARRNAPKATSQLTNSIRPRRITPLHGVVKAGTDYAEAVETGTGPGGSPPIADLLQWIRVKRIEPRDPSMDQMDLAFVIADSIVAKGTPAQPFMAPAIDSNRDSANRRLNAAVTKTLEAI